MTMKSDRRTVLCWEGKQPADAFGTPNSRQTEIYGSPAADGWMNRLYCGENLLVLQEICEELAGQVDFIYMDPPFDSCADYKRKVFLRGTEREKGIAVTEAVQYRDIWEEGEYLQFIYERLLAVKRLLKPGGNLVLHCDWHRNHHLRCLMDEVFGAEWFHNEIAYCYSGGGIPRNEMPKKHDVLLWYSNGDHWTYHAQYREYSEGTKQRGRTAVKGDHAALREQGTPLNDWWTDVKKITSPTDREKLYYPTQKSEALLERLLEMLTDPGDLVLDFFMGAGTAPAAAMKLGRRFLGADCNPGAVELTVQRLVRRAGTTAGLIPGISVWKVWDAAEDAVAGAPCTAKRTDGPRAIENENEPQTEDPAHPAHPARTVTVRIHDGYLEILELWDGALSRELKRQQAAVRDWRQCAEAVFIDWKYDGQVFRPQLADLPDRRGLVAGRYEVPADAGRIMVKVTDSFLETGIYIGGMHHE